MEELKKSKQYPAYYWSNQLVILCVIFSLLLLVVSSCGREVSRKDYVTWVTAYDNGLHVKKTANDFVFDLQYKPNDLIALERGSFEHVDSLKYFTLKIAGIYDKELLQQNASYEASVQQNLYYYSYLFQDNLFLNYKGVKLPCVLYHFEHALDSKGMSVFNLGFDAPSFEEDVPLYLEITSDKLYSLPVRLKVTLNNVPKLQL